MIDYTVEVMMPRHWRWTPFLVAHKVWGEVQFQHLLRNTHAPAIFVPELRATIYWPRPLHLPVRWAYKAYAWWLWHFIFPLARPVLTESEAIWMPFRWVLDAFEWHGDAPTLRRIENVP